MLNIFLSWAKEAMGNLPSEVYAEWIVGRETADSSARLDVDTPSAIGRITCWETGAFYAEALDRKSGQDLFGEHGEFDSLNSLAMQMQPFLTVLGSASAPARNK